MIPRLSKDWRLELDNAAAAANDEEAARLLVVALVLVLQQRRWLVTEPMVRRLSSAYKRSGLPIGWFL